MAIILLGFAAPAHATDNTVELTIGSDANLKPSAENATLYKATTLVKIKTAKPYGFNLTIRANSSDLINSLDNSHRISGGEYSPQFAYVYRGLNSDMWGYQIKEDEDVGLSEYPNSYLRMPSGNEPSNVLIDTDVEGKRAGCKRKDVCEINMVFGANLNSTKLAAGSYSTTVTYTATAKPAPKPVDWHQRTAKTTPSETCQAGNTNSSCLVTLDPNMIPVKYTGSPTNAQWTSVADPEAANSGWYDYANKQWANAITVKPEALAKYRGFSRVVDQADILGFWVYIPRYTYEVMRRDGTDKPVKEQNFDIKFENTKTPKKCPLACKTGKGKDYRTECNVSRELPLMGGEVSTWTTHPAFSFGKKELNGIWFAKFETTGEVNQPTVLPNEAHISGYNDGMNNQVGNFYSLSKTLGVDDPNNVGGSGFTAIQEATQNNHHLVKLSSHMVNNNDWGAATYLSASKYGAGYNGVQINSQASYNEIDRSIIVGTTGCGPYANGDTGSYSANGTESYITYKNISSGSLGTQQACSSDGTRAYNTTLGQLASTTNNPTGIYDMSGGGYEYVAASYTTNFNESGVSDKWGDYFGAKAHPPYVNTYNFTGPNSCTFATCGGQALYETNNGSNNGSNQWNGNYIHFATSSDPWFVRGGMYSFGSIAGLFGAGTSSGHVDNDEYAFRVALAPTAQN